MLHKILGQQRTKTTKPRPGLYYTISKDDYNVAGLPMQFNITVSGSAYPFYFRFDLFENVTNSSAYLEDVREASKSFIFPATTPPGNYSLKVQVYFVFDMIRLMKISGPGHIEFEVKSKCPIARESISLECRSMPMNCDE